MRKTILIAASDPNIIYLLKRYAEESGFAVQTQVCKLTEASSPGQEEDLLGLIKRVQPAMILLQIDPPEMRQPDFDQAEGAIEKCNWRTFLRRLKADADTRQVPVVAYSYFDEVQFNLADGIASVLQTSALYSDFVSTLERVGVYAE